MFFISNTFWILARDTFVALWRVQGFSEALEILWLYTNDSTARAIYLHDKKKRDGKNDRQN
jgi:hypothetical protein